MRLVYPIRIANAEQLVVNCRLISISTGQADLKRVIIEHTEAQNSTLITIWELEFYDSAN